MPHTFQRRRSIVKNKKLSHKQQRELVSLPLTIENLEKEITELQALLSQPDQYQQGNHERLSDASARLPIAEQELEMAFLRWAELEDN